MLSTPSSLAALSLSGSTSTTSAGSTATYIPTAAYALLRTPWGRSEAFADLATALDDTSPLPAVDGADPVTGLITWFLLTGRSDLAPPAP